MKVDLPSFISIEFIKISKLDNSTIQDQVIAASNMYIALRTLPEKERNPIIAALKKQFNEITE